MHSCVHWHVVLHVCRHVCAWTRARHMDTAWVAGGFLLFGIYLVVFLFLFLDHTWQHSGIILALHSEITLASLGPYGIPGIQVDYIQSQHPLYCAIAPASLVSFWSPLVCCTQGFLLALHSDTRPDDGHRGPYGVWGIDPQSSMCKANAQELSLS